MIKLLKKLFMPSEGRTFDMTKGSRWGNAVRFDDNDTDVYGWLSPLPRKNDIILFRTTSGEVCKYRFTEVRPCGDPPDMFFGKVKFIG